MNKNLMNAAEKAAQMNAMLRAIENEITQVNGGHNDMDHMDAAMNLLYLAQKVSGELVSDIEKVQGDETVVNVIKALNENRK